MPGLPSTEYSIQAINHINKSAMAPPSKNSERIEEAQKLSETDPSKAEAIYQEILSTGPGSLDAALREYEAALMGLGELYRDTKRPNELANLVTKSRSTLSSFAKAKTAKLGQLQPAIRYLSSHIFLTKCHNSSSTPRSLLVHAQHSRSPNFSHKIMHRMGHLRTPRLPTSESRNAPRLPLHAEAVIL